MDTENTKEQNLRDSMYGRMHLSAQNEPIARQYLNMENEEDAALLAKLERQDLTDSFVGDGYRHISNGCAKTSGQKSFHAMSACSWK